MSQIYRAAETLASILGGLPQIDHAYPYPKLQSQLQPGNLVMAVSGTSPPGQAQGAASQEVAWDVVIALRSATTGNEIAVQQEISDLLGLHPTRGILGVLYRNTDERAAWRQAGYEFYLDQDGDGINVEYDTINADNQVVTLVRATIYASLSAEEDRPG